MKKFHLLAILFATAFSFQILFAQDSPVYSNHKTVSVEEMIGDKRQFLQLIVNKMVVEKAKFGLLSVSSYAADYKDNLSNNEFQSTTLLYQHLFKGVSISSGVSFTSAEGLKNFVGLQYMYKSQTFTLVYIPAYYFIRSHKISNFALLEFKPAITENWSVYSRLQLHYNHDLEKGNHFRSYVYSHLGLTYMSFSFGLAHNYDSYGATKNVKSNIGVFLKLNL